MKLRKRFWYWWYGHCWRHLEIKPEGYMSYGKFFPKDHWCPGCIQDKHVAIAKSEQRKLRRLGLEETKLNS